jgi:hypothetical protein
MATTKKIGTGKVAARKDGTNGTNGTNDRIRWVRFSETRPMNEEEIKRALDGKANDYEVVAVMNLLDVLVSAATAEAAYPGKTNEERQFLAGKVRALLEVGYEIEGKTGK